MARCLRMYLGLPMGCMQLDMQLDMLLVQQTCNCLCSLALPRLALPCLALSLHCPCCAMFTPSKLNLAWCTGSAIVAIIFACALTAIALELMVLIAPCHVQVSAAQMAAAMRTGQHKKAASSSHIDLRQEFNAGDLQGCVLPGNDGVKRAPAPAMPFSSRHAPPLGCGRRHSMHLCSGCQPFGFLHCTHVALCAGCNCNGASCGGIVPSERHMLDR